MNRIFSILLCFFPACICAQDTLSIRQAIEIGLENNFSIRLASKDQEIAENNVTWGNAGFLPRVDLNLNQNNNLQSISQEFITGEKLENPSAKSNSWNGGAALGWTLFDGLKMFATYDKLKELQTLGQVNTQVAMENQVALITAEYYALVQQKQRLAVLEENLAVSDDRVSLAQERYRLGSASEREWLLAQVDANSDRSLLVEEEVLVDRAKARLNRLMGRDPSIPFFVSDQIPLLSNLDFESLKSQMLAQNPNLLYARGTQQVAGYELKEVQSERSPFLDVSVGYNYNQLNSEAGFLTQNKVSGLNYGFSIGWNLYDGSNLNRRIQNAKIAMEATVLATEDLENQLETNLREVYLGYANNLKLLEMERENLSVSRRNLDIARQVYEYGDLTALDFREAQRNHFRTEDRFITALIRVKVTEIELLRLSGRIGELR